MDNKTSNEDHEPYKNGRPIPEIWTEGALVYIHKNKGDPGECGNYMPICLTQIIYKIR